MFNISYINIPVKGGGKGGGGGCEEKIIGGNRKFKQSFNIPKDKLKPGIYHFAMKLDKVSVRDQQGGVEKFCKKRYELSFSANIDYLRIQQGDPFYDQKEDIFGGTGIQDGFGSTIYFNTFLNSKYSSFGLGINKLSFVISSNLKNPIDIIYNLLRSKRFANLNINEISFAEDDIADFKTRDIDGNIKRYTNIKYKGFKIVKDLVNVNLQLPDSFSQTDETNYTRLLDLIVSYPVGNEKLADIIQNLSFLSMSALYYDNEVTVLFDGMYKENDDLLITDISEFLLNKDSWEITYPKFDNIPTNIQISYYSALKNFTEVKYLFDFYKYISENYNHVYANNIQNKIKKVVNLNLKIAPDIMLYLDMPFNYDSIPESEQNYNSSYFSIKATYRYWHYIKRLVWQTFAKAFLEKTLKIKTTLAAINLKPGMIIRIQDDVYEEMNGRQRVFRIKELGKGKAEIELKSYDEIIYIPDINQLNEHDLPPMFNPYERINIW